MVVYLIKDILLLLVLLLFIACSLTTFLPEDPSFRARAIRMDQDIEENNSFVEQRLHERQ